MDLYRNVTTQHKTDEQSPSKHSLGSPAVTPTDARQESQADLSRGSPMSVPSASPRLSTNGPQSSAAEMQVQQLCEIFPEKPRSEIESMLVRYNYDTELIASVLASGGVDDDPRAASTPGVARHHSAWRGGHGELQPMEPALPYTTQRASSERTGKDGYSTVAAIIMHCKGLSLNSLHW